MPKQKGISSIALIIIIALILVAGYLVLQQKKGPTSENNIQNTNEQGPAVTDNQNPVLELGFSFKFSQKFPRLLNADIGVPIIVKETAPGAQGEFFRGYLSSQPFFWFAGMSRDYAGASREIDPGEFKDDNCGGFSPNRVTTNGSPYYYAVIPDEVNGPYHLALFKLKSAFARFPCLGFAAASSIAASDFLEIVDSVSVY